MERKFQGAKVTYGTFAHGSEGSLRGNEVPVTWLYM